jgi:hypothetical protein
LVFISGLADALLFMHLAAKSPGLGGQWVSRVSTPYGNCSCRRGVDASPVGKKVWQKS